MLHAWVCLGFFLWASPVEAKKPTPFESLKAGMERRAGLLTVHVDEEAGEIWLELPADEDGLIGEYLYVESLLTGLGSNPVGLDRGQLGPTRLVRLRTVANRLLIEEPNLAYRALSGSDAEARAASQSFASSVLWAGPIEATAADGRALVNLTSFLVRDAHGVARQLEETGQGSFALDLDRSVVDPSACLAFPDNLEFEAVLTYEGSGELGAHVRSTAPTPDAITLVQHHSLIRLPDDDYAPRTFHPRLGSWYVDFQDYAAPLDGALTQRWIGRHRLQEGEPLVYYVDPGAPEPIRSALLDGARWWEEAFAAAGFPGAFRVELLPEGAHPLDVRYNVIQWVHRSTRGWSYGYGVVDPRSGEIVKGHVTLGSLRVRQDRVLFEGLVGTARTGSGAADDPIQLALARIRQLSAHEVGHTLGLAHNFAASQYGRASVMDYPAPLVQIDDSGRLDLGSAYSTGLGAWDLHAIRAAYGPLDGDESEALVALARQADDDGLLFLTDQDARPVGAGEPRASLWDNGEDAVEQLELDLRVRRIALESFGEDRVGPGAPLALLEEVLATVYFRHRYQLEAAVKTIGGVHYGYVSRGDASGRWAALDPSVQRRALASVLRILEPSSLELPESVLTVLQPRPFGYPDHRELFAGRTGPVFDALGAAASAADQVIAALLQPERAARLVELHRRNPEALGFDEVLGRLVATSFEAPRPPTERRQEIERVVQARVVSRLIGLSADAMASPAVRARAEAALLRISARLQPGESHDAFLSRQFTRFMERSATAEGVVEAAPEMPPGSPIGGSGAFGTEPFCTHPLGRDRRHGEAAWTAKAP